MGLIPQLPSFPSATYEMIKVTFHPVKEGFCHNGGMQRWRLVLANICVLPFLLPRHMAKHIFQPPLHVMCSLR